MVVNNMRNFVIILFVLFSACKRDNTVPIALESCMLSSIRAELNPFYYPIPSSLNYKVERPSTGILEFHRNYYGNYKLEYRIFLNEKKWPVKKELYDVVSGKSSQFYIYTYSGNLLGNISSYETVSSTQPTKSHDIKLKYLNEMLVEGSFNYYNASDSINPSLTPLKTYFTSTNGNSISSIDSAAGTPGRYYVTRNSENVLKKDFYFLCDPLIERYLISQRSVQLFPFLMNKNTTLSMNDNFLHNILFEMRVAENHQRNPLSIVTSFAIWDFTYSNCK